jgi:hypothetical protein
MLCSASTSATSVSDACCLLALLAAHWHEQPNRVGWIVCLFSVPFALAAQHGSVRTDDFERFLP